MKTKHRFFTFLALVALCYSNISQSQTSNPTSEETATPKSAQFSTIGWTVACQSVATQSPLVCEMSQVIRGVQGQVLLNMALKSEASAPYRMTLQLPHGLHLPSGVQLQVDKGELMQLDFTTSLTTGTYVTTKLAEIFIDELRKGNALTVRFKGASKEDINVPISLVGFDKALTKMK